MKYDKSIRLCKMEIAKYSRNLNRDDVEWIKRKLLKFYGSELKGYEKDPEKEYSLLYRLSSLLYSIQSKKPKDIKTFVDRVLREKLYSEQLSRISDKSTSLNLGDEKECDKIEEELSLLLNKANKEIPGFEEKRSRKISEIYADLIAIRTKGKRGSARMLNKLLSQVLKQEMKKKQKEKGDE